MLGAGERGKLYNANTFNFVRCTSYDGYMQNDVNIIKILKCILKKMWILYQCFTTVRNLKIKQFLKLLEENIGTNLSNVSMMSKVKDITKCLYIQRMC